MLAAVTRFVIFGAIAAALTVGPAQGANWTCGAAKDDGHVKAIFAHANTKAQADAFASRVRKAFKFVKVTQVGCADWIVYVTGLDTSTQQREFTKEAEETGFPGVSYQTTTDLTLPSAPGKVKAIFGTYRTAAAASSMLQRAAASGFRIIGLGRYGLHVFKVVVADVPLAKSQDFAAEARSAGLRVTFDLG